MPDVHVGKGATVGSVIPCVRAIIPAAVGVDIGCGIVAVQTSLTAADLPDSLRALRLAIEEAVPHGRTAGGRADEDEGGWDHSKLPRRVKDVWATQLADRWERIVARHPAVAKGNRENHLGTLGTGNHFIELCLDQSERLWCMLHSGSRGVGNRLGTYFIELAKRDMKKHLGSGLPDANLAYFKEGSQSFEDYVEAVEWAQSFARWNRRLMLDAVLSVLRGPKGRAAGLNVPDSFRADLMVVDCHHNYVSKEIHFGEEVYVTRKGAVRAGKGELGIIPGSMGAKSYIVRGRGNPHSFLSCSHGAGRALSRTAAKKSFSVYDHAAATQGVECRKDAGVIDETPAAYKDIDAVMAAQGSLVEVVHTLKQILCVKG